MKKKEKERSNEEENNKEQEQCTNVTLNAQGPRPAWATSESHDGRRWAPVTALFVRVQNLHRQNNTQAEKHTPSATYRELVQW